MAKDRFEPDDEDLLRLSLTDIDQETLLSEDDEARLAKAIEAGKDASTRLEFEQTLTLSQRRELARTARDGETAARELVQSNLGLVVSIAKRYRASGLPLLDLIREGNLGLRHAVEKFDWRMGSRFSTQATWWIRQAITRGIVSTDRTIRLRESHSDPIT